MLLSFCLILFRFQPSAAYKNVAYKKKRVLKFQTAHLLYIVMSLIYINSDTTKKTSETEGGRRIFTSQEVQIQYE